MCYVNSTYFTWLLVKPLFNASKCFSASFGYLRICKQISIVTWYCLTLPKLCRKSSLCVWWAHGWRKFWNIHALKTETDLSGSPLWGLHSWWSSRFLSCWRAHCFWKKDVSNELSSFASLSLRFDPISRMWLLILSLRFLYMREMVGRANRACRLGSSSVTAWNADITVWISSRHRLYWSSTWIGYKSETRYST